MNASNLPQLRPHSNSCSGQTVATENDIKEENEDEYTSLIKERTRNGSGSFKGADESDEEIAFRGDQSDLAGYNRLQTVDPRVQEEEKIKRKLKFFFFNPVEKYYATRKLPWKLCLQILKVFLVTAQLWIFAGIFFTFNTCS